MNNIIVRVIDLPCSVRGAVSLDVNGDYSIYLNARLNRESQRKAFRHELKHIKYDHFFDESSAVEIERSLLN